MGFFDKFKKVASDINENLGAKEDKEENRTSYDANLGWPQILDNYPKWELCPIKNIEIEDDGEFVSTDVYVDATAEMLAVYGQSLVANGFEYDGKVYRKDINNEEHGVNFSRAEVGSEFCAVNYYIYR